MTLSIKNRKVLVVIMGLMAISLLAGAIPVFAQTSKTSNPKDNDPVTYTLLEPLPCLEGTDSSICTPGTQVEKIQFREYVKYAFNLLIALAAVAAVFMIVWGGFQYMTSDAFSGKKEGLSRLQNALYGLLLVLGAFLILRTIDPRLVEIPTTLVKPLDIKYDQSVVNGLFSFLNSEANKIRSENINRINSLAEANKKLSDLEKKRLALVSQYNDLWYGEGLSEDDPRIMDIKRQISDVENQERELAVTITSSEAKGRMDGIMQQCYGIDTKATGGFGNKYNLGQCQDQIREIASAFSKKLDGTGDGLEAQKIRDYGEYASSISTINAAILTNLSTSPSAKAAVDTLQSIVTIGVTGAGTVYGGFWGGTAGFIVSQFANAGIAAIPMAQRGRMTEITVAQIQYEVNNTANKIFDNDIRQVYTQQAYTLIKSLGGKGDGTDSTQPYLSEIKREAALQESAGLIQLTH